MSLGHRTDDSDLTYHREYRQLVDPDRVCCCSGGQESKRKLGADEAYSAPLALPIFVPRGGPSSERA